MIGVVISADSDYKLNHDSTIKVRYTSKRGKVHTAYNRTDALLWDGLITCQHTMSIYVDHPNCGKGKIVAINGDTDEDYTEVQAHFKDGFHSFNLVKSITNGWLKIK